VAAANVLVAATEGGVRRLLLAGSLEEPDPHESWPVPASPYAAAKLGAGAVARMCHALYGTPVVWLRLFMVYGPAQPDVRKLIPHVTLSLLRGEAPRLSNGKRLVDWIYVDDVVRRSAAAVAEAWRAGHSTSGAASSFPCSCRRGARSASSIQAYRRDSVPYLTAWEQVRGGCGGDGRCPGVARSDAARRRAGTDGRMVQRPRHAPRRGVPRGVAR
jgi:hypothetical protein